MPIHIRKLTASDVDAFRRLRLLGLEESPPAFAESPNEFARRTPSAVQAMYDDPEGRRHAFGAFTDAGELVGVVGVTRDGLEKMRHKGYIWGVFVAPAYQGQGIAKRLMDAAIAHARTMPGLEQLRLIVGEANPGARRLYESLGFTQFGLEPRELKTDGTYYNSLHMWLEL
jgi:ribosomal protein S18 acetylase RimI-like enzyme